MPGQAIRLSGSPTLAAASRSALQPEQLDDNTPGDIEVAAALCCSSFRGAPPESETADYAVMSSVTSVPPTQSLNEQIQADSQRCDFALASYWSIKRNHEQHTYQNCTASHAGAHASLAVPALEPSKQSSCLRAQQLYRDFDPSHCTMHTPSRHARISWQGAHAPSHPVKQVEGGTPSYGTDRRSRKRYAHSSGRNTTL